jgi:hypothetical protein
MSLLLEELSFAYLDLGWTGVIRRLQELPMTFDTKNIVLLLDRYANGKRVIDVEDRFEVIGVLRRVVTWIEGEAVRQRVAEIDKAIKDLQHERDSLVPPAGQWPTYTAKVMSFTDPNVRYDVKRTNRGLWTCSCPAWKYGEVGVDCKHIAKVKDETPGL